MTIPLRFSLLRWLALFLPVAPGAALAEAFTPTTGALGENHRVVSGATGTVR